MTSNTENLEGVLLVDKPSGMTSHDVVDRVRKIARMRRVGHTGTLDPIAEGLMLICLGGATRISQFLVGLPKEYTGTIKLGAISSTYDAEGSIETQAQSPPDNVDAIEEVMRSQVGWRVQLAPPYSAVKVRGKKLYEYARQGEVVPQKHRRVQVHRFDLIEYREPEIRFRARVGSGTYIRAMAHDLGIQLECGAYLASLRRESIGTFRAEDAVSLALLMKAPELLTDRLLGLDEALAHLPKITIAPEIERAVLNGGSFTTRDILVSESLPRAAETSVVLDSRGRVLSIVRSERLTSNKNDADANGDPPPADDDSFGGRPLRFRPVRVLGKE